MKRILATAALVLAACGGQAPTPDADLMANTTVGKNRCAPGKATERPFAVEWDATDVASFEAKAARDVVLVKVDGCELKVLDCRDDGIPGKYGSYDAVQWTTGVVEGFSIKNEGDLYAKLPFGASSLAANVKGGNELELKYFVSGSRPTLRSLIYRNDIAANPLCASATHFVSSYDLGAYDLAQKGASSESADVKAGNIAGGGNLSHSEGHVKSAGSLADCTKESAKELSRCRVPIRLALRAIQDGTNPAPAAAASSDAMPTGYSKDFQSLMQSASKKMQLRDGPGCLADLDRADTMQKPEGFNLDMTRAVCEMLVGKCNDGRRRYRAFLARTSPGMTPEQQDNSVLQQGITYCEGKEATPLERVSRANRDLIDANAKNDVDACTAKGKDMLDAWPQLPADTDKRARAQAEGGLRYASDCISRNSGDCQVGQKLWQMHVDEIQTDPDIRARQYATYQCPAGKLMPYNAQGVGGGGTGQTVPAKPKKKKKKPAAPASGN